MVVDRPAAMTSPKARPTLPSATGCETGRSRGAGEKRKRDGRRVARGVREIFARSGWAGEARSATRGGGDATGHRRGSAETESRVRSPSLRRDAGPGGRSRSRPSLSSARGRDSAGVVEPRHGDRRGTRRRGNGERAERTHHRGFRETSLGRCPLDVRLEPTCRSRDGVWRGCGSEVSAECYVRGRSPPRDSAVDSGIWIIIANARVVVETRNQSRFFGWFFGCFTQLCD